MLQVNLEEFNKLVLWLENNGYTISVNNRPYCRDMLRDLEELNKLQGKPSTEYDVGAQVIVYKDESKQKRAWDAICGWGSLGVSKGLLEVMGRPVVKKKDGATVVGYLTADEVIRRLQDD